MVLRSLRNALVLVASIVLSTPINADVIELRADEWCPYNCTPGSERPGYMIELAREALGLFGHQLNYETMNWPRSIQFARTGRINGIVGAVPDEAPDLLFGPALGAYRDVVAFRVGEVVDIYSESAIEGLRVGAINGYDYGGPISAHIEKHKDNPAIIQFASGDQALENNLRKLAAGRLDAVAEVHDVLVHTINSLGMNDEFEIFMAEEFDEVYIAFSPELASSEVYIAQLAEGLARLRSSGRYAEILSHYGLDSAD